MIATQPNCIHLMTIANFKKQVCHSDDAVDTIAALSGDTTRVIALLYYDREGYLIIDPRSLVQYEEALPSTVTIKQYAIVQGISESRAKDELRKNGLGDRLIRRIAQFYERRRRELQKETPQ